jgi:hypothetical protein
VASLPTAAVADVLSLLAEYMPECPHLEFILRWLRLLCIKHGPALQVCFLIMSGSRCSIALQPLLLLAVKGAGNWKDKSIPEWQHPTREGAMVFSVTGRA